ncbi:MAG: cytidylate kinase-like family protein [Coriobacteriales bacterium]
MKHIVVNIGCEYGSGGPEIGKMVASDLGIEYYDRDLVDKVGEALDVDRTLVEQADNDTNVRFSFDTSLGPRTGNLTNKVIYTQFDVIRKMAQSRSCVIIGRCGNYILEGVTDSINVFVYAPEEVRVRAVMNEEHLSERKAQEVTRSRDRQLHERYKYITGTNRGDRAYRDLMVDSSVLGWARTARLIEAFVEMATETR